MVLDDNLALEAERHVAVVEARRALVVAAGRLERRDLVVAVTAPADKTRLDDEARLVGINIPFKQHECYYFFFWFRH